MRMTTVLDVAYVAATAIATAYVLVALGVAARGRSDVLHTMAGDAFAYAIATSLAAVIAGQMLRAGEVELATLVYAAVPFGMTAAALHAVARREASSARLRAVFHTVAVGTAIVFPLALGVSGWS